MRWGRRARPAAANLYNLSSHFIVEEMRRGRGPRDAAMEALKRVKANTVEKRLLDARGNPSFQLIFYAVNKKGEYAGVSMYAREGQQPERFAVCTEKGPEKPKEAGLTGLYRPEERHAHLARSDRPGAHARQHARIVLPRALVGMESRGAKLEGERLSIRFARPVA
jgi:hypothetical protein